MRDQSVPSSFLIIKAVPSQYENDQKKNFLQRQRTTRRWTANEMLFLCRQDSSTKWPADTNKIPDLFDFSNSKEVFQRTTSLQKTAKLFSQINPVIITVTITIIEREKPPQHTNKTICVYKNFFISQSFFTVQLQGLNQKRSLRISCPPAQ